MARFTRLSVRGFRRLGGFDLPMRDLVVMIGANGAGRSSILDVFSLLAASARGGLAERMVEMGGLVSVLTTGKAERLELGVEREVPGHAPLRYQIALVPSGTGYAIESESLTQDHGRRQPFKFIDSTGGRVRYYNTERKGLVSPTWEHHAGESALSQVPKMYREPEEFRQLLASSTHYHALDVSPRAPVRLPQPLRPDSHPGSNGEALISCLYTMRETDPGRFERVTDCLEAAMPGFERLSFPPVAAGVASLTLSDARLGGMFYPHQLSEGQLRFLWLVTLLLSKDLPSITLIDEPEVSLHPELLGILAELMREASRGTQLVVATHSDRFIRALKPEVVMTADVGEDGLARFQWADEMDLSGWLAEYALDEIWAMGRMGGRA